MAETRGPPWSLWTAVPPAGPSPLSRPRSVLPTTRASPCGCRSRSAATGSGCSRCGWLPRPTTPTSTSYVGLPPLSATPLLWPAETPTCSSWLRVLNGSAWQPRYSGSCCPAGDVRESISFSPASWNPLTTSPGTTSTGALRPIISSSASLRGWDAGRRLPCSPAWLSMLCATPAVRGWTWPPKLDWPMRPSKPRTAASSSSAPCCCVSTI